ncbi:MAG: PIN domain-containing protein [Cyclobacteriaceae bacterium]
MTETKPMTTNERFALDTNVLMYLHEVDANSKKTIAIDLMASSPVISNQVLSEYLNVLRRLLNLPKEQVLNNALSWLRLGEIIPVNFDTLKLVHELIKRYDLQLFDSIIVAAALEARCSVLYSEDMQHELLVNEQLRIINPFL